MPMAACRGADRARRGPGLCLRRRAGRSAMLGERRGERDLAAKPARAQGSCASDSSRTLLDADAGLCYRLRSTARRPMPGAQLQCRPRSYSGQLPSRRPRRASRRSPDAVGTVHRDGGSGPSPGAVPVQSDVLSQRLGLAPRQCPDHPGLCPHWFHGHVHRGVEAVWGAAMEMELTVLPRTLMGFGARAAAGGRLSPPCRPPPGRARGRPACLTSGCPGR